MAKPQLWSVRRQYNISISALPVQRHDRDRDRRRHNGFGIRASHCLQNCLCFMNNILFARVNPWDERCDDSKIMSSKTFDNLLLDLNNFSLSCIATAKSKLNLEKLCIIILYF